MLYGLFVMKCYNSGSCIKKEVVFMSLMREKLEEILDLSEKMLGIIKKGFPIPDTQTYKDFFSYLVQREESIKAISDCTGERDIAAEKALLHKVEKIETEIITMLETESITIKNSIDTVSKGKKAVKDGYLNTYDKYSAKNRFSKRG